MPLNINKSISNDPLTLSFLLKDLNEEAVT
jgi:hypothetical protein